MPLCKKISSIGDTGLFAILAMSSNCIISESLITLIGISEIFLILLILSFSLKRNSEFLSEETPIDFFVSSDFIDEPISWYVRPNEVIFTESISMIISSSVGPKIAVLCDEPIELNFLFN